MSFIRKYFVFSSSERKAVFWFCIVLLILLFLYLIIPKIIKPKTVNYSEFETQINSLLSQQNKKKTHKKVSLFNFNPNTATKQNFLALGLSEKQIQTIINYRNKGGFFYKKEDFKKIYGISTQQYYTLFPYIIVPLKNKNSYQSKKTLIKKKEIAYFEFNPNTASKNEFRQLGLSQKQAQNILNYRVKGGFFYQKEDLKKIYSISENEYQKLSPYIVIPNEKQTTTYHKQHFTIELNTATPEELEKINGIGEKLAARIIKYREILGGYHSINQLAEVYGIEPQLINNNKPYFVINSLAIKTLNINTFDIKNLASHPYLSYNEARIIVNFRKQHGKYKDTKDIVTNELIKLDTFEKVKYYLVLN